MVCEDKKRLLDVYQYVAEKYSDALNELKQTMGTLSKADYDALYRKTEALRHDGGAAQSDFQSHVTAHRC